MKTYNHAFTLAFSVGGSIHPNGEDVTAAQFEAALTRRMRDLTENDEWSEAVGFPDDTYVEEVPKLDFTVIAFQEDTGRFHCEYVKAASAYEAFSAAAEVDGNERLEFVVALPGIHKDDAGLIFPGSALVSATTVLEQPEVFGGRVFDSDMCHDFIVSHGFGTPTDEGMKLAEDLFYKGNSYAEIGAEITTRGLTHEPEEHDL